MQPTNKRFGVRLLRVGEADIPGPELFWMREWDTWFTLVFQSVLVQGDETDVVAVDDAVAIVLDLAD